ncbi:MAG: response regulator [Enterocloster sp.]
MKLLIADDEKLTREGIYRTLDLEKLGISQVFLADDGLHGLDIALTQEPDIILTDVRMPRMNGVEMAEQILKSHPDTGIIFMSAYSDKEYLKAAIKLKAVSYVEKPLDMTELIDALKEAAENCRARSIARKASLIQEEDLKSRLALLLTEEDGMKEDDLADLFTLLKLPLDSGSWFSAVVLDSLTPISGLPEHQLLDICGKYGAFLESLGLNYVRCQKADRYVINFIISEGRPDEKFPNACAVFLKEQLEGIIPFFIACGPWVNGMDKAYLSCQDAFKLLKISFFCECSSILVPGKQELPYHPPADKLMDFTLALTEQKEEEAQAAVCALTESIVPNEFLSPSQIRDLYYRYLGKLEEISLNNHISLWNKEGLQPESIWEGVMECSNLSELHQLLLSKIQLFFERLRQNTNENPVVFQIKEYLHRNYADQALSVPDVSDYVRLSPSYVCTLFKNETGQTLNQYLTDYRIRMSKQFLSDPRYKIADISSKVGYSDGNYYSKTFRKLVGLSPSEYREKMLS